MQLNDSESKLIESLPAIDQEIPEHINDYFNNLRQKGDEEVDSLVKDTLAPHKMFKHTGRQGYNHLLDIADVLAESPELALNQNTAVAKALNDYPQELKDYFNPCKVPDWVDEKKLAISSELWQKDMLAIISVLYSISLPACYLMKKGIPALYQTAKLTSSRYIYQRIYETGLMLDAVLAPNGLQIVHDIGHSIDDHFKNAIKMMDPDGHWEKCGSSMVRNVSGSTHIDPQELEKSIGSLMSDEKKQERYLWGKGYITAKKVRFLHASMRFMLMNPDKFPAQTNEQDNNCFAEAASHIAKPYDAETLGVPVNQEDQAYTLLTFAYCIPNGLEKWGRRWSQEEKEAFLHTWKVIGYTIGIQGDLLTDNWDDAERLFHFIQRRQADESEQAKKLICALINFFQGYLPRHFGLNKGIAARLIRKQLGEEQAALIMPKENIEASGKLLTVIVFAMSMLVLKIFYRVRRLLYKVPFISAFFKPIVYQTGTDLVNSWRDVYSRKPYYVAKDTSEWQKIDGANPSFIIILRDWRHKLFNTIALGLGSLVTASISLLCYFSFWFLGNHDYRIISGWSTLALAVFGIFVLRYNVRRVSRARPKPEQHPVVDAEREKKLEGELDKENQKCANVLLESA